MEKKDRDLCVLLDINMALYVNQNITTIPDFISKLKDLKKKYDTSDIKMTFEKVNVHKNDELSSLGIKDEDFDAFKEKTLDYYHDLFDFMIKNHDLIEPLHNRSGGFTYQFDSLISDEEDYIDRIDNYIKYIYEIAGVENVPKITKLLKKMQLLGIRSIDLKPHYPSSDHHIVKIVSNGLQSETIFDYTDGKPRYINDSSKDKKEKCDVKYEFITDKANYVIKDLYAKSIGGPFDFANCKGTYDKDITGYCVIHVNNLLFSPNLLPKSMRVEDTLFAICPMIKNQMEINSIMKNLIKGRSKNGLAYSAAKKLIDKLNTGELTNEQRKAVKDQIESIRLEYLNALKMIYSSMDLPGEDIASLVFKDDGK